MTSQTLAYLKKLALTAPVLPRQVPSHLPAAMFYDLARREVPVLIDELERLRAELEALKSAPK